MLNQYSANSSVIMSVYTPDVPHNVCNPELPKKSIQLCFETYNINL